MVRLITLLAILSFTVCASVAAQEAPAPEPSHEYSTLIVEPEPVAFVIDFAGRLLGDGNGGEKLGFYPVFGRIVSGAGWISLGGGYRERVLGDRAIIDASTAVSWRAYKLAQTRFEFTDLADSHLAIGAQLVWQDLTQVNYFGTGPDSSADLRSEYRLKTADLVAYGTYRPTRWLALGASGGRLDRPVLEAPTGPFDRDYPDARFVFADDAAFALRRQPAFAHGRASITADTRNYPDHASRGGLYEIAWSRYGDLDFSRFSFTRYEAEAAHFVPFFNEALVLALHGWTVMSDTAEGQTVPVYLMPGLGGGNTLRAYPNFRFHDRNLLVGTAEARVALTTHLDVAAFVDSGSVASKVEDLRLGNNSYGLGLRVHTHKSTAVRIDGAHGREGWRVSFSLSDPFRLKRLAQHTATVPFVP